MIEEFAEVAARADRCVWLDGGGAREWSGRRSILAWCEPDDVSITYDASARAVTRHRDGRAEVIGDDVFAVLEAEIGAGEQWFGYLGYACRPDLPARASSDLPDAVWLRPSRIRVVEVDPDPEFSGVTGPASPLARESPAAYRAAFAAVQQHLRAGDTYELNLTERHEIVSDLDPVAAYLRLRSLNPAPYAGFLQHRVPRAQAWLLSSSPERFALIDADRMLETKPIKGTTPRGATPEQDVAERDRLATDPRFRAENLMIVDLLRNDLAMVCEPGLVAVPQLMQVESYANVHQLVSTVRGRLRPGISTVEALRALFPAGSMTGAPKLRTMQLIDAIEATPRGAYAGAFGWISGDGRADLGVVIRSLTTTGEGRYRLGTGGGITVMSEVDSEYAELAVKAARLRAVF